MGAAGEPSRPGGRTPPVLEMASWDGHRQRRRHHAALSGRSVYNANGDAASALHEAHAGRQQDDGRRVRTVLEGVVKNGTGTAAAVSGVTVAGKTGTAENANGKDNSWFVGMAPSEDSRVVVALIIENGGSGAAAQKAQNVLKTALEVQGLL
ncbi:MAG: penicillin-binding transpeptidase domain-containing protein [Eggerthellaceae bacterium]